MALNFFGFKLVRDKTDKDEKDLIQKSFATPEEDGSSVIQSSFGSVFSHLFNIDYTFKDEVGLINQYRSMVSHNEVDNAIDDVINEAIVSEDGKPVVNINLDNINASDKIKENIREEFSKVLSLMDFNRNGYEIFRQWYIDGRQYWHKLIIEESPEKGIIELRRLDPRRIKKVKEIKKERTDSGVEVIKSIYEYFIYNDQGFQGSVSGGVKIFPDAVAFIDSGLLDITARFIISHLNKAIRPLNQLKMLEDSVLIYRISRAPERRIFYVDVGTLPKHKAEEYLRHIMNKYRNRISYDPTTGTVNDEKRQQAMLEDFWLPRREGGRGTEVTTLPAGCLSMNTKIPLTDGRHLTIREIEKEISEGKKIWIYSCDPWTGKVVPGLVSWAGVTQKSAKVVKLTLSNGEELISTLDHQFPIQAELGNPNPFIEAKNLVKYDLFFPFHEEENRIYDNVDRTWKDKSEIFDQINNGKIIAECKKIQTRILGNYTFTKIVEILNRKDLGYIRVPGILKMLNNDEMCLDFLDKLNRDKSPPHHNTNIIHKTMKKSCVRYGYNTWEHFRSDRNLFSVNIIKREILPELQEVGTLTIDSNEEFHNYHTFALSAGIFTKNSQLGEIDDVIYFQKKLYKSLNVPITRMDSETGFSSGRTAEITRDELKFTLFVKRLRKRFSCIFLDILRTQLLLKRIITEDEWEVFKENIFFDFLQNSFFTEFKNAEILTQRVETLTNINDFIGRFFSVKYIQQNVLKMSEDEIERMEEEIKSEKKSGKIPTEDQLQ